MPSGSFDRPVNDDRVTTGGRYGPAGFLAALVNILLLEFLTWVFMLAWYMIPVTVLPAVIINALIGYGLSRTCGTMAQIGRGMLVACISAPFTVVIFISGWVIAQAIGPV